MNWGSVLPAYPSFVYLDKKRHEKANYCNIPQINHIQKCDVFLAEQYHIQKRDVCLAVLYMPTMARGITQFFSVLSIDNGLPPQHDESLLCTQIAIDFTILVHQTDK